MTTALANTRTAILRRGERVLPQYSSIEYRRWWPWMRFGLFMLVVLLAAYSGLFVTVGGVRALALVGVPIGILGAMVLWMLPDVDRAVEPPFYRLLLIYLMTTVMWPNYVAIALPGLPWITPPRMVLAVLLVLMALHFSQHRGSRQRVGDIVLHDRMAKRFLLLYWAAAIWVLPLAPSPVTTLNFTLLQETFTLAPAVIVAWVLRDVEKIKPIAMTILLGAIFTMLVAIPEAIMEQPPWMNYIPSFMMVDPDLLHTYLGPQARVGDNRYRIRSTQGIVIFYTEYLCIIMPLLLHYMLRMRGSKVILAGLLSLLILTVVWFANARTGSLSILIALFGTAGLVILRSIFFSRGSDPFKAMFNITMVALAAGVLLAAIASSHRLQMYTIGGSQHAGSNQTREVQWDNAKAQLRRNPIGVGLGNSANIVASSFAFGVGIVDSYYINLLVGVGPLGFIGFMGCMARLAWLGLLTFFRARDDLEQLAGPFALGIISFIVVSYVVSTTDHNYLLFVFGTCILALHRRQEQALAAASPPALAAPKAPSRQLVPA